MKGQCQIVDKRGRKKLEEFLVRNGQILLPVMRLIEGSQAAVDELIDVVGRTAIEAVLQLSAREHAGPRQQGRQRKGEICWYGSQRGTVRMSDRKVGVRRPRLRRRGSGRDGEVEVPAYEAMRDNSVLGARMLDILMRGVSTRNYGQVITQMAGTAGVSRSSVSREFLAASEEELKRLMERRFDDVELLVIYIDGIRYGHNHVIAALGVDLEGRKHVLGITKGSSESGPVVTKLLNDLVSRGVKPDRKRLFVIDGSQALRNAINAVYGADNPVGRCRNHKIRNVLSYLPKEDQEQVKLTMKAAYKLDTDEGIAKLEKMAQWLEKTNASAATSLLEGLEETFTVNRLGLTKTLRRCLATTNIIENPYSAVRRRTNRVTRWRDEDMVKRWVATALVSAEKSFRRIMGYKDLWMLKATLDEENVDVRKEVV